MPFRRPARRTAFVVSTVLLLLLAAPAVAHADPPAPTDFRSRVTSIEPAVPGVSARIIGGDSFFELSVDRGVDVLVLGYEDEPYLRFLPDGEVQENERSPTRFLSESKYRVADPPAEADADAAPEWRRIASDGRWSWHDHRTHWMSPVPPADAEPGDQILSGVVRLEVDGRPVEVHVSAVLMAGPSSVPRYVGWFLGFGAGLVVMTLFRRRLTDVVLVLGAMAALVVGAWQTWSLPAETGPPATAWALPAVALVVAVTGALRRWSPFTAHGISLVVAVQLAIWGAIRRDVLDHAILPTDAPFWLDRAVSAGAVSFGIMSAIVVVWRLVKMVIQPPGAQPAASM